MSVPAERYSTGLQFLDRRLYGGLHAGSLLAITAPVGSQSELLLHHMASMRSMLYLSTTNPAEVELREAFAGTGLPGPADLTFQSVSPDDLLADPEPTLERIQPESFVVVNPVDRLERTDAETFLSFANRLKERLRETDSVGVLHGYDTEPIPDARRLMLERADYVWQIEQRVQSREITVRLLVTKARGGSALTEPLPLVMSDQVRVDTSYRIA